MKTLKSTSQNLLATIDGKAVFMSNLQGEIYKQFPVEHFKNESFTEEVPFPGDFIKSKEIFNARNAEKRAAKEAAQAASRKLLEERWKKEREERKERVELLWKIRKEVFGKGLCKVYLVMAEKYSINNDESPELLSLDVFIDIQSARKRYESLFRTEPEFGYKIHLYLSEDVLDKEILNETSYDGLMKLVKDNGKYINGDRGYKVIEYNYESIEGAILVTWEYEKYIGYSRRLLEIRRGYAGEKEDDIYEEQERVWHPYTDVLLSADQVEGLSDNDLRQRIVQELDDSRWKWSNDFTAMAHTFVG